VEELFAAVREACSATTWSRGVELARGNAVVGQKTRGDEVTLSVRAKAGAVAPTVLLYLEDEEWSCSCRSSLDACVHVAAAAIALKRARKAGKELPGESAEKQAHVGYRLQGRRGPLILTRVLVRGEQEQSLGGSLAARISKRDVPGIHITEVDLAFEKNFSQADGAALAPSAMEKLLRALKDVEDLRLEGRIVRIGGAESGLRMRVDDVKGGGFVARLEQDPMINEIFDNGVVRIADVISPIGRHGLADREFDMLRRGRVFDERDVGELVGSIIPAVKRHLPVQIDTANLPGSQSVKPRLQLDTVREGHSLEVLASVVYGDPAVARLDGNRLTLLGDAEVPIRNARLEKLLVARLRDEFGLEPGVRTSLSGSQAILLAKKLGDASQIPVSMLGNDHEHFFETSPLEPQLQVMDDGSFSLWFAPDDQQDGGESVSSGGARVSGGRRADAVAVVRAWREGEDFAPLLDGGFGRVPAGWLEKHGHLVADLMAAREHQGGGKKTPTMALPDLAALCAALDQPAPPGFDALRALVDDFEGIAEAKLPSDLQADLRDYQILGVNWLSFLQRAELGGLLADDMGLGKTIQALCVMRGRCLVVAPTSVLQNWASEAQKFRPDLKVAIYHGPQRSLDPDADLTLTTYAILRIDIDKLTEVHWDCAVLDEAQAIKNPSSKVARAAYRIDAGFRLAMTGTPVENHLDDLWSQFHFMNRGLLGGYSDFQERYVKGIAAGQTEVAVRLRERIRPFVLRRLKKDVAKELPPRTDLVLRCELEPAERRVYDAVRVATQQAVVEKLGAGNNVLAMLEALLRLRQAACHGALLPGTLGEGKLDASEASSKIKLLLESLSNAVEEGHKALVFSQWTSLLNLVEPHLDAAKISFNRLDGSTRDRGGVVNEFQDPNGPQVMLLSLKAGGTGLNLTAADHVFLLDPWWNPAVEDQAADRAHRIGQDNPVFVHRLVAVDTVEERILGLQDRKRRLADVAVGDASQAKQISRNELMALLD